MVMFPMLMISSTLMISRLVLILTRMIMSAISSTLMISRLVLILTRMILSAISSTLMISTRKIMSAISSCSGRDANERRRRSELGEH